MNPRKVHITVEQLAALVNGDDILFASNKFFQSKWLRVVKSLGFELSPGKSLEHQILASVNSQQWRYVIKDRSNPKTGKWFYTPYARIGLLIEGGASKVKNTSSVHDLASVWNDLRTTVWDQFLAMKRFLQIHRDEIRHVTKDGMLNLFASCQNGGLGFHLPECPGKVWDFKYTRLQRAVAFSRNLSKLGRTTDKPTRGGIKLQYTDTDGKTYSYVHPNQSLNAKTACYLVCERNPVTGDEMFPITSLSEYCPLGEDPALDRVNCSSKRVLHFLEHSNNKTISVERVWQLPRWGELKRLVARSNTWRDSELAKQSEMQNEYVYVPVVKIGPA
jgi:hypothetical protein